MNEYEANEQEYITSRKKSAEKEKKVSEKRTT